MYVNLVTVVDETQTRETMNIVADRTMIERDVIIHQLINELEMWANAQPDGRPAEYR